MLRASPLKPTKGSAFGNRKPLKRLDLNFECLGEVCQLIGRAERRSPFGYGSYFIRVNLLIVYTPSETCRAIPRLGTGGSPVTSLEEILPRVLDKLPELW